MAEGLEVIRWELEAFFVERALGRVPFDPTYHEVLSFALCLQVLEERVDRQIAEEDLKAALSGYGSLKLIRMPGMGSATLGVDFELFKVLRNPGATAASYRRHLKNAPSRVPKMVLEVHSLELHHDGVAVRIRNEGYGREDRIEVEEIQAPDWVEAHWDRAQGAVHFQPLPLTGGVYQATVVLTTTGGPATLQLTRRVPFQLELDVGPLWLKDVVPEHPDVLLDETRVLLHQHLTDLGLQASPGEVYQREQQTPQQVDFTRHWQLTPQMLKEARLPAKGFPERVVLVDEEGVEYPAVFRAGLLQGKGLQVLFEVHQVIPYMHLHLGRHLGMLRVKFTAEPWQTLQGHTYCLVMNPDREVDVWVLGHLLAHRTSRSALHVHLNGDAWQSREDFHLHQAHDVTLHPWSHTGASRLYVEGEDHWCCFLSDGRVERLPCPPTLKAPTQPPTATRVVERKSTVQSSTSKPAPQKSNPPVEWIVPYQAWQMRPLPHPETVNRSTLAKHLLEIIQVEGPLRVERAYYLYLTAAGCGAHSRALRSVLNKAMHHLVVGGKVMLANELGVEGYLHQFVRTPRTPMVRLRQRGPRSPLDIPPSEVVSHVVRHSEHKGVQPPFTLQAWQHLAAELYQVLPHDREALEHFRIAHQMLESVNFRGV